ncbi:hypothetical protein Ancab_017995 [Ancistrocladus abbreviatus]
MNCFLNTLCNLVVVWVADCLSYKAVNSSYWLTSSSLSRESIVEAKNSLARPVLDAPFHAKELLPLEAFRLTKELLQPVTKDNIVIVTFGNFAFAHFIFNWVKHLTDLGLLNLIVGAMDTKLRGFLYFWGIPVFSMPGNLGTEDVAWGSSRYPEAYLLASTVQIAPTVSGDILEHQVAADYNKGVSHWRPTESSKKLVWEWKEMLSKDEKIWDQDAFNQLVQANLGPSVDNESGLVYGFDGNLKLGILPASIFCSGHTYFVQAMP